MTKKAEFNAEEWASVVEGPVLAGMRVVTSSRGGTIRESLAMGKVYTAAREAQGSSELLDELVTSPPAIEGGRIAKGADVKALVGERLTAAVASVEANATPEEA